MITKRPERLKGVSYFGLGRYFLTICTAYRRSLFVSAKVVDEVKAQLLEIAASNGFSSPAHCFMPDHMHALVEAGDDRADFRHFAKTFKQISGFRFLHTYGGKLWQPGYHERILRDDEATEAVVRYIWENPIRAGLTKELGEYPYCGSDRYTLSNIIDVWQRRRT